jgi:hypothetical protein
MIISYVFVSVQVNVELLKCSQGGLLGVTKGSRASSEPFRCGSNGGGRPGIQNRGMDAQSDYNREVIDKDNSILYNVGIRHIE